jgi:hypothetical protein
VSMVSHLAQQGERMQGDLLQALSKTMAAFGYQVQCLQM